MGKKNRFQLQELTGKRILNGIARRMASLPDSIAWKLNNQEAQENRLLIKSLRQKYRGKRCFIIGNGPSLNDIDFNLIRNEFSFGSNRIYLLQETKKFLPSFYVSMNELVLEQYYHDISALPILKFINWNRRHLFVQGDKNLAFLNLNLNLSDQFITDLSQPICSGGTVTFVAMQIAYYLGFTEVYLIGVDHNFIQSGTPNTVEIRNQNKDQNHFDSNYFPKGAKWQYPDLVRSEIAYRISKVAFENDGRKILDATVNGKCQVFEKVDYYSLFS